MLGFVLDQFFLDVASHFGQRFRAAAVFIFNLQNVIVAGVINDVADSAHRHVEGEFFQRLGQSLPFDPAPVATIVFRAVLGIHLRHLLELRATGEFAEHFFREFLLRRRARGILVASNHNHAEFDLLLGRKFVSMFPVVIVDFDGRNDLVRLDVVALHRAHNKFFHLLLFEFAQAVVLRLQGFDKRVAVAAKRFPDDLLHLLIHEMIRNLIAFLFESLNDEAPIDQVF